MQACQICGYGLIGSDDHQGAVHAQENLLYNAADIPGTYPALPVATHQDQVCIPGVGNFNNLFSGSAIIKMCGYQQTGIL
jgi:hypothetical protein